MVALGAHPPDSISLDSKVRKPHKEASRYNCGPIQVQVDRMPSPTSCSPQFVSDFTLVHAYSSIRGELVSLRHSLVRSVENLDKRVQVRGQL